MNYISGPNLSLTIAMDSNLPPSLNTWASPSEEQNELYSSHIGKTEGRVYFAGEHTTEYHGWMQGALQSGIRAAEGVHYGDNFGQLV